jgi:hypothetical protein
VYAVNVREFRRVTGVTVDGRVLRLTTETVEYGEATEPDELLYCGACQRAVELSPWEVSIE